MMIIAVPLILLIILCQKAAPHSLAGDNAVPFAVLCSMINLATTKPPNLDVGNDMSTLLETIAAINMTISGDDFAKEVDVNKPWEGQDQDFRDRHPGWHRYYPLYVQAKKKANGPEADNFEQWKQRKGDTALQKQIKALAEKALEIKTSTDADVSALNPEKTTAKLNKALYGTEARTDDAFKFGTASEASFAKLCSQTGSSGSRPPGYSLIRDAFCLCAHSGGSEGAAGKACCGECTKTAGDAPLTVNTAVEDHWKPLQQACTKLAPQPELPTAAVAAAATTLSAQLTHKTRTQNNHDNVLRKTEGSSSGGCTGNNDSGGNTGKCIVYKHGLQTTGTNSLP
uniref:Variant surface glycoprotein 1125.1462 n=1 Tax=Trypanosoma brucei TaxID=5691 RepID=A0A1J0R769_9TRYP|nr:variant surface glycoprotein 1125.1462 [Trypanosoma brucei]